MTLFQRRSHAAAPVAALAHQLHQWHANGDHPDDHALPGREGAVVRYFRHPDYPGSAACPICHHPVYRHGWIDSGGPGHTVCPGNWIITTATGHIPVSTDALTALVKELDLL